MAEIKETLERELKLCPGPEFELPELGGEVIEPRVFDSTYHDTRDHRLARHGVTLRHRIENRKGLWQLKLPLATRRSRAFLRAGRELIDPEWSERLHGELRWLGGELGRGRGRDLDVLIERLSSCTRRASRSSGPSTRPSFAGT